MTESYKRIELRHMQLTFSSSESSPTRASVQLNPLYFLKWQGEEQNNILVGLQIKIRFPGSGRLVVTDEGSFDDIRRFGRSIMALRRSRVGFASFSGCEFGFSLSFEKTDRGILLMGRTSQFRFPKTLRNTSHTIVEWCESYGFISTTTFAFFVDAESLFDVGPRIDTLIRKIRSYSNDGCQGS